MLDSTTDVRNDGAVVYKHDEEARREAAAHPAGEDRVDWLREQCERKTAELGESGVRGHSVGFSHTEWDQPPGLPDSIPRTGRISRGDLLDIGLRVCDGVLPASDLFAAVFVWGWGRTGYGPHRYRAICAAAGDQLEQSLQRALTEVSKEPGSPDVIAGYAQFYGGCDHHSRAAPGQAPWSRLRGFGPAFFTKFLYFSTPGALILDKRLANAVHNLSELPYLVDAQGDSLTWTPYRYAVYLHWMRQTAHAVGFEPEMLELTLFEPPGDLNDEDESAD